MAEIFHPRAPFDLVRLIDLFPLAWVVSRDFQASPLPLLAEADEAGEIVALIGHMALSNPLRSSLARDPDALILFSGPAGYVSPRLVSNRTWGPTWNYAVARFEVEVEFLNDGLDGAIERLVSHMEAGHPDGWSVPEMGSRYAALATRIIAFRAHVRASRPRFKLGQDETDGVFGEILAGLGEGPLADWMRDQRGVSEG